MLRLVLYLITSLISISATSQTFYGIIFTNTNDKTIGKSATKNTENIKNLITEIASNLNYTLDLKVFNGKEYTFEKLDSVLKNFKTSENDVVFFYLNSHGYKSSTTSEFPRVYIPSQKYGSRYLVSADDINRSLSKKSTNVGLLITIFQACNRLVSKSLDLPIEKEGISKDLTSKNYRKLFSSKENIIVTSSQRGKTSIATRKRGSYFTQSFVKAMRTGVNEIQENISWEQVLEKSKRYSLMLDRTRHPVWNISKLGLAMRTTDTLSPYKIIYDSAAKQSHIVFGEMEMPLNTINPTYISLLKNIIKSNSMVIVQYDSSTLAITSIKISPNKKSSFEKVELEKALDTITLIKEIPFDSVQRIFDYFVSLSCTRQRNCNENNPCLTFDYKQNGCNARAHWMRKLLADKFGYDCEKIFVESNRQLLTVINDGACGNSCIKWGWHVAIYIQTVNDNGTKQNLVIDPSLFTKAVSVQEWVAVQKKSCCSTCSNGDPLNPYIRPPYQNSPNGHRDNLAETKSLLVKFCKKCQTSP